MIIDSFSPDSRLSFCFYLSLASVRTGIIREVHIVEDNHAYMKFVESDFEPGFGTSMC